MIGPVKTRDDGVRVGEWPDVYDDRSDGVYLYYTNGKLAGWASAMGSWDAWSCHDAPDKPDHYYSPGSLDQCKRAAESAIHKWHPFAFTDRKPKVQP